MIEPKIPYEWHDLLMDLRSQDPTALLAGGAIRDLVCGIEIHDLDFFTQKQIKFKIHSYHYGGSVKQAAEYGIGNNTDQDLASVTTVEHLKVRKTPSWWHFGGSIDTHIVTCINWQDPLEFIERFDFGLCMIAYDGEKIIRSRHFDHDFDNKVFTLRRAVSPIRHEKSTKRWEDNFRPRYGWPMELSGQARLDQMLRAWRLKGQPASSVGSMGGYF